MKVFMLGWEFPPFISGGLGTACYGLTKAMSNLGIQVTFALPKPVETDCEYSTHVKMLSPSSIVPEPGMKMPVEYMQAEEEYLENVKFHTIKSLLQPYFTPQEYEQYFEEIIRKKRAAGNQLRRSVYLPSPRDNIVGARARETEDSPGTGVCSRNA